MLTHAYNTRKLRYVFFFEVVTLLILYSFLTHTLLAEDGRYALDVCVLYSYLIILYSLYSYIIDTLLAEDGRYALDLRVLYS
jgi:hypothetical protein